MSLGPFDLTGGPFLLLYGWMLIATIVAGFAIPRWLRPEGRDQAVTDPDQIAWLAGGAGRFSDMITARLLARHALIYTGNGRFDVAERGAWRGAAEAAVLGLPAPMVWGTINHTLRSYAEVPERKLIDAGLVMDDGLTQQMRFWQTLPYLLLVIFGGIKWEVGTMRDRPVGFLTALLVVTALCALIRLIRVDRRTRAGQAALAEAVERSARLRRAPTAAETDMAVALFGTAVLTGSAFAAFHQMRSSNGGGGDGGGSGGGDGGGDVAAAGAADAGVRARATIATRLARHAILASIGNGDRPDRTRGRPEGVTHDIFDDRADDHGIRRSGTARRGGA